MSGQQPLRVLILELLWQHTEVIGTWLDYFCSRGAEVTVYYPEFEKTPHNYITIWAKLFKFTFNTDGLFNLYDYDLIILNTSSEEMVKRLHTNFPCIKMIAVGHYATRRIAAAALQPQVAELPVNPFFDRPWAMPVCRRLADAVADSRRTASPRRNILIIGNSFLGVPAPIFNAITSRLRAANYSLTATLYSYNDISGYDFSNIEVRRNIAAIDLYKYIEDCRFILFFPADYHYMNQLSGTIPLCLTFGRPLITLANVLQPYAIEAHYKLDDPALIQQLEDGARYAAAQAHLQVRLNEYLADSAAALESCLSALSIGSQQLPVICG